MHLLSAVSVGLLLGVVGRVEYGGPAQSAALDCTIEGSQYPELMPEHYVWEF